MNVQSGQQLLHYRIVEKIGKGGMGEVWKAVDTTLDRDVAVKLIPGEAAADKERLARFVREAKILAALHHPNIAAVYGLHESSPSDATTSPVHFIAMELVPGEDLAERLGRGPLAVDEAIDVGRQVAEALEAAHEQGVIHRDLKPANIKVTPEGKVKVLDLGLAKALAPDPATAASGVTDSPTITAAMTHDGTILGTAAYMSPEQAKGRPVDRRADIWAFGVILYEMLTGRRLFEADTASETLAAVLRDDVSLDALPRALPAAVVGLLRRCLDRDLRTRLRDIGEARIALSTGTTTVSGSAGAAASSAAVPAGRPRSRLLPWALAVILGAVAAVSLWRGANRPAESSQLLTLVAPIPDELRPPDDQRGVLALAPDGQALALALASDLDPMLYLRRLDGTGLVPIPGTEDGSSPFFSPDGEWVGFFADDKLKKVRLSGGSPVTLCAAFGSNRGADWGTDDVIVFTPHYNEPLMRVSGAGGEATPLTSIDTAGGERTHRWPQTLPGADLVLFTVGTADSPENYDDARIEALRPSTGERHTVLEGASMARYLPSGHLVFARQGSLFAVPFDVDQLETRGSPVPVLERVMGMRASGIAHVAFSRTGLLAYFEGHTESEGQPLAWHTRGGAAEPLAMPGGIYNNPRISPDGTRIAIEVGGSANSDIATYDIRNETLTRLTFAGNNTFPVWSPDGRWIAFASFRGTPHASPYRKAADGSGEAEPICSRDVLDDARHIRPFGWTADGKTLLLTFTNDNGSNLAALEDGADEATVLVETPATETMATLSPNGRWLAYASDEERTFQIFVLAYPGLDGKWQVSTDGGNNPRWSPDGQQLFYRQGRALYAVTVDDSSGRLQLGRPELVFDRLRRSSGISDYDVLDANRLLVSERGVQDPGAVGVTVLVNWMDELERRVPR